MPITANPERDRRSRGSEADPPIHRRNRAGAAEPAPSPERPPRAAWLFLSAVLWLLAVLALATHHAGDPGFTTSGAHERALNAVGRAGAWFSDVALFVLGYSVWWLPLIVARHWLSLLAARLRGASSPEGMGLVDAAPADPVSPVVWRLVGVVLLLTSSAALEWSMKWLGFNGSGVFWIALLVLGVSWAFAFSWLRLAEQIGGWLEGLREQRQAQREHAEDVRLGEQALRERTEVVEVERRLEEEEHQGAPETAVPGTARHQAATGGPVGLRTQPPGDRFGRHLGDDLSAD